jgi:methylmalonyl-CoA/ethylmalonyl-CoA epimerase
VRIDHLGIVVPSIAEAVPLYRDALGGEFLVGGDNDVTGVRLVHLMLPGLKIELMQPLRDDSIVSEFLARRGPGFHHLTTVVDDLPETLDDLTARGFRTVGADLSSPRWSEAFLSPRDTFGSLLQFVSTTLRWDVPASGIALRDVLAGRVVWRDWIACLRDEPASVWPTPRT